MRPSVVLEMIALLACALAAWVLVRSMAHSLHRPESNTVLFGRRLFDGVLFPLVWLVLGFIAQLALARVHPLVVIKMVLPALLVLVVIRSLAGREAIVNNEHLITSRVDNLSLADPHVWLQ